MQNKAFHNTQLTAIFGGTFDPIHYGHIKSVTAMAREVNLEHIIILPNNIPPHRPTPEANAQQRLKMVKLAIEGNMLFSIDKRELDRLTPSYTIDTLEEIRYDFGYTTPLAFIIGQDSFLTLHTWDRWEIILNYCHLIVCARPKYPNKLEKLELQKWFKKNQVFNAKLLSSKAHGYIYFAATPLFNISATDIRQRYHQSINCDNLFPQKVQNYIKLQRLYR
ncbi:nicotinate-nucleotide adenylyltransferase [Candidatus Profftia sp. (ex Adelges kitamiensis)]|uniref:nicotinate-nucleotide adenylyltransferase n=1 Tax=Candidatus Profftia sp. (ex Adelges kitamiensis) TaxID=2864218 RepID=UPI001CE3A734|nr:nicotinate-nucleotide adenylyltransferase [Candidatus Profftia sp. (ex Adelges kitamiensis)]